MLRRRLAAVLLLAGLVVAPGRPAAAEEVIVQNDGFESGGPAVIVGDFIPGEHAGVRLTAPCDGRIVGVQIGWLSGIPQDPSLEEAIHIYEGETFPQPGGELETLLGPVLTPGFLNEFRYTDKAGEIPIDIPVNEGDEFIVTLEFANPTDVDNGGASVFRDIDGCQQGRNVLFALNFGGWVNFCLFITGDIVMRAIIDCDEGPGACCFETGQCFDLLEEVCLDAGGTFRGIGTLCAETECPSAIGACCFEETGGCLDLVESDCVDAGGLPQGPGTRCADIVCFPVGACCLPDGNCLEDASPDDCTGAGGTFQGDGTSCALVDCPAPLGGCCFDTGFCLVLPEENCILAGAMWAGAETDCRDDDGSGTADVCETACPEDLSGNGAVDFADVLAILAVWGPCPGCPEDLSGNGAADFADIVEVLAAWGPCG